MIPIIDIVGAPGVGKTTLSHELTCLFVSKKKYRLVTDTHVLRRIRPWMPNMLKFVVQSWNLRTRSNSLFFRFLWIFFCMPASEEYWGAINSANYEWIKFIEFIFSIVPTDNNRPAHHRMKGLQFFLNTCEQRMLLEKICLDNVMILSDESLSYRPSLFSLDGSQQKLIDMYYKLIPLPNILVFIDASTECIIERICKRKSGAIRHINKKEKDIAKDIDELRLLASTAYTEIKKRGVDVIKIDAENPHDVIKNDVLLFLDTIKWLN